jgi:hypothetical protein
MGYQRPADYHTRMGDRVPNYLRSPGGGHAAVNQTAHHFADSGERGKKSPVRRYWGMGLTLCCCCVVFFLFSETCIAFHADHNCRGEGCPVCSLIRGLIHCSRQLKSASIFPVVHPGVFLLTALAVLSSGFCSIPASGVRLKVRMYR